MPIKMVLTTDQLIDESFRHDAWIDKRGKRVRIKSAEIIRSIPMRCITVDSPSRLYLCGKTAIPTHNTFALLFEMARHYRNPNWGGVIFRHEAKQILNEGGLRDSAMELYPGMGAEYRSQPMPTFTFPSGARVSFAHINLDTEVAGWQGSQIPTLGLDELCHFSAFVFFYMMSRNRSTCGIKPYIRCSTNPDPDSWVADFIAWWIDQETGYPIKERGGAIRYFIRRPTSSGMEIVWGDTRDDVAKAMGFDRPKDSEIAIASPGRRPEVDGPVVFIKHEFHIIDESQEGAGEFIPKRNLRFLDEFGARQPGHDGLQHSFRRIEILLKPVRSNPMRVIRRLRGYAIGTGGARGKWFHSLMFRE
jgi:hypothetical protein